MPEHSWGDTWFQQYGIQLNGAMDFIVDQFLERTGERLSIKEKYGTIRYEFLEMFPLATLEVLREIVLEAVAKWPDIEDEILEDIASYEEIMGEELCKKYWN